MNGMNLLLRPLHDVNDVTWSIVISLVILLLGVGWIIKYILEIDERESHARDRRVGLHPDLGNQGSQDDV
jgi:putative effector of murein hydrolase LrgA (UPF0299 family)